MQDNNSSDEFLVNELLDFEKEQDLFSARVQGVLYWERIRFKVHQRLLERTGITGAFKPPIKHSGFKDAMRLFRAPKEIYTKNCFRSPKAEILFVGHPRRKRDEDGYWWDVYFDPIMEGMDKSHLYLESPYRAPFLFDQHFIPPKTEHIRYLDLGYLFAGIKSSLGLAKVDLTQEEHEHLKELDRAFTTRFNVSMNFLAWVPSTLKARKAILPIYKKILKKVRPSLTIFAESNGKENFIEACKELGITSCEFQHGAIGPHHMGYNYPGPHRVKYTFPDHCLCYGDYWKELIEWPVPKERILPVGYPYFEKEKALYQGLRKKDRILFISQGAVGPELSRFAVELSQMEGLEYEIVYKLHPGEADRWKEEYPWLKESKVEVIDDEETPLYRLFGESKIQIGVYSTAIFEGLCFGLSTVIVNIAGAWILQGLVDKGAAIKVSTPEELIEALKQGAIPKEVNTEHFFRSNALSNIHELVESLSSGEQ